LDSYERRVFGVGEAWEKWAGGRGRGSTDTIKDTYTPVTH